MIFKKSDPNVRHVLAILQEMASVSDNILRWGVEGNEPRVRSDVDRMRQLTSDLQQAKKQSIEFLDTRPIKEKQVIDALIEKIDRSREFRTVWMQRYKTIAPPEVVLELEDGVDSVLDMAIPEVWDWNYDVVAFTNRSDARLISAIIKRGQKRVIVLCADENNGFDRIDGVEYLDSDSEIERYMNGLRPRVPKRIYEFDSAIAPKIVLEDTEIDKRDELFTYLRKSFERSQVNLNTVDLFGSRWLTQGVCNLPVIAKQPSFRHLLEKMSELPLVIISPGPSLEKNVKELRHLKGKAILLAPAQSVIVLQKNNITPDIVMIADPADLLYLVEDYDMTNVAAVLTGVSCHPDFFNRHNEKIISFNVNGGIDTWISEIFDDTVSEGACGSVSSMAFLLGTMMRCNPIILVGQDLSFSGQRQYAESAVDGQMSVLIDNKSNSFSYTNVHNGLAKMLADQMGEACIGKIITLPGYYGGTVQTKGDYAMFHAEFERIAKTNLNFSTPTRLLNCTEGGAYIEGFEHIPLTQAINEVEQNSIHQLDIPTMFRKVFSEIDRETRYNKLQKALKNIISALSDTITIAKSCHQIATMVESGRSDTNRLSAREKQLIDRVKGSNFVSMAIQGEIRNIVKLSESATTLKQNLDASKLLYKLILSEAQKIFPVVEASMASFEAIQRASGTFKPT